MDDNKNLNQSNMNSSNNDDYQKILDEYAASIKPEEETKDTTADLSHEVKLESPKEDNLQLKDINSPQLEASNSKFIPAPDATSTIKSPILNQPVENESKESLITQAPPFVLPHEVPESSSESKTPEEIKAQIDRIFADDSSSSDNFSSTASPSSSGSSMAKNLFFLSVAVFFLVALGWIYFLYFYQQPTDSTNVSDVSPTPTEVVSQETCELNGTTYKVGESFKSADGCNTCSCQTGNTIACTEMACDITPTATATKSATKTPAKVTVTPTKSAATSNKTEFQKMIANFSLYKDITSKERLMFTNGTTYWTGSIKSSNDLYSFTQKLTTGSIKSLTISKTNLSTILGDYTYEFYLTPNYKNWTTDQFIENTKSQMTGIGDISPLYASSNNLVWTTAYASSCGGVIPDTTSEQKAQEQCNSLVKEIQTTFP